MFTQASSQDVVQQNESEAQIAETQALQPFISAAPWVHTSWAQVSPPPPQVPAEHIPEQHSVGLWQPTPSAEQVGLVPHTFALQLPEQQSPGAPQGSESATQVGARQRPASQEPLQHVES